MAQCCESSFNETVGQWLCLKEKHLSFQLPVQWAPTITVPLICVCYAEEVGTVHNQSATAVPSADLIRPHLEKEPPLRSSARVR
jgi:hypothetical protein